MHVYAPLSSIAAILLDLVSQPPRRAWFLSVGVENNHTTKGTMHTSPPPSPTRLLYVGRLGS